jgi:hypothetical protein
MPLGLVPDSAGMGIRHTPPSRHSRSYRWQWCNVKGAAPRLGESAGDITGQRWERVTVGRRVAAGAEQAADCGRELCLPGGGYRKEIGPGKGGVAHGLLLRDRLGGIWEVASGANHPEPLPTELK